MDHKMGPLLLMAGIILVLGGAAALYNILPRYMDERSAAPVISEATREVGDQADQPEETEKTAAPDFAAVDADGNTVRLSDLIGTPIVLNFWASWCGPCVTEMPDFQQVYEETDEERVRFVMVNLTDGSRETLSTATAFLAERGFTFPVLFDVDQEGAYAYGVRGIPTTWFIDAQGNLAGYWEGGLSREGLLQGIAVILAENDG